MINIPTKVRGDSSLGSSKSRIYIKLGLIPCAVSTKSKVGLNIIISSRKVNFLLKKRVNLFNKKIILLFKNNKKLSCVLESITKDCLTGEPNNLNFLEE
jgi:ribosomal protein L25 (general stress protein Ctc)